MQKRTTDGVNHGGIPATDILFIAVDRSVRTGGVGAQPPRRGSTPVPRPKSCGDF
jgi:hypothetical protein